MIGVVVPMTEPLAFVARNWLVIPVMARFVVEAFVSVVFPSMLVAPVLEPMVANPERVYMLGRDVVAFSFESKFELNLVVVQNRLFVPSVRASVVVP